MNTLIRTLIEKAGYANRCFRATRQKQIPGNQQPAFYESRPNPYDNRGFSCGLKSPVRRAKVPATSGVPRRKAGSAT